MHYSQFSLSFHEYKVGQALIERLTEGNGSAQLVMKCDGVSLVVDRLHHCDDLLGDWFRVTSTDRFCWSAKRRGLFWELEGDLRRVVRMLAKYEGCIQEAV